MADSETDALHEQLQGLIGTNVSKASAAPDPVNMPMIRRWVDAFDDRNPVYENKEAAAATRHGDEVNHC